MEYPCGIDGVKELLPHREPFIWVSRIIECEPGISITAELDIDPDLELFKGHFPDEPVFPGVLIMEALAQAATCCIMSMPDQETRIGYFAGIDKAKFREMVLPGDTLVLKAQITAMSKRFCKADVEAYKNGKLAAQAQQKYILG